MLGELTARIDLDALYPPFRTLACEVLSDLDARHLQYFAISGLRSIEDQRKLYAQGRIEEGGRMIVVDSSKVVTNARPGMSAHNYGIAIDVSKDANAERAGLQPDWNISAYEPYALACKDRGLDAAYFWTSFREGPHCQLNLRTFGISLSTLQRLYEQGGMGECWAYLDSFSWH